MAKSFPQAHIPAANTKKKRNKQIHDFENNVKCEL